MAAPAEVQWSSGIKPLISATYASFNKNNLPALVDAIIKRWVTLNSPEMFEHILEEICFIRNFVQRLLDTRVPTATTADVSSRDETSRHETPTSHCSVSSSQIRHSFSYEDVVPAPSLKRSDCGEACLIV